MLPDPLHPAVVHLPLALAVLLPLIVVGAGVAIHRGAHARPVWLVPVAALVLLAGSAWVATETGEREEDRVEEVLASERPLHEHEEAAETFLLLSGVVGGIGLLGLAGGRLGAAARWVTLAGSVVLVASAVQVGSAGGELVYEYGAADAYRSNAAGSAGDASAMRGDRDEGH